MPYSMSDPFVQKYVKNISNHDFLTFLAQGNLYYTVPVVILIQDKSKVLKDVTFFSKQFSGANTETTK